MVYGWTRNQMAVRNQKGNQMAVRILGPSIVNTSDVCLTDTSVVIAPRIIVPMEKGHLFTLQQALSAGDPAVQGAGACQGSHSWIWQWLMNWTALKLDQIVQLHR